MNGKSINKIACRVKIADAIESIRKKYFISAINKIIYDNTNNPSPIQPNIILIT